MPRKPRQLQQQLAAIKAARGSLRRKPGGPSFAERMAAFNAEERALEQRREDCLMSIGAGKPLAADKLLARLQRLKENASRR